jgi:hypothetical protein
VPNSSVHTWQPIVDGSLPRLFLQTPEKKAQLHVACPWCKSSSEAVIFTPCPLDTGGLQVNHTRNMSPPDLELQHDQASAGLPIKERKYSNIVRTI